MYVHTTRVRKHTHTHTHTRESETDRERERERERETVMMPEKLAPPTGSPRMPVPTGGIWAVCGFC